MKKILALLLALVMALGCIGAFAEETSENTAELPSFTMKFASSVDVDALAELLPLFGVDETTAAMLKSILPLFAEIDGQLVFADYGAQLDLGLKGQTVLTLGAEMVEGGFVLASDILPSYMLTLDYETIENIFSDFAAQAKDAMANVDFGTLLQNLTVYLSKYTSAVTDAITFGDPEVGEYTFEELEKTYNCMTPIIVDTEAIKTAIEGFANELKNDESIASLISALGTLGLPAGNDEAVTVIIPDQVSAAYFANVDAEGNPVGEDTLVAVETVTNTEDTTVSVNVYVLVEGKTVSVAVNVPEQEITVSVTFMPTEDGAAISCQFAGNGITAAENIVFSMGEVIQLYTEDYLMDKLISTQTVVFGQGGERTFTVLDENKTAVSVEQLMADTEGEISGALLADVMSNGLGALIAKVSQIMPDEVNALMNLFTPNTVEEPVE